MSLTVPELGSSRSEPQADWGFKQRSHPDPPQAFKLAEEQEGKPIPSLPVLQLQSRSKIAIDLLFWEEWDALLHISHSTAPALPHPPISVVALPSDCFDFLLR